MSATHAEAEAQFRQMLDDNNLPAPDEVQHNEGTITCLWHDTKIAVVIEIEDKPMEFIINRTALGAAYREYLRLITEDYGNDTRRYVAEAMNMDPEAMADMTEIIATRLEKEMEGLAPKLAIAFMFGFFVGEMNAEARQAAEEEITKSREQSSPPGHGGADADATSGGEGV